MDYKDLLGQQLKCDFLHELFETYDVDVIYSYDRTYDNLEDFFCAEIPEMGLEFSFNHSQKLTTLFMKNVKHSGYNPFTGSDPRNVPFKTGKEACKYTQKHSIQMEYHKANNDSFLGTIPEWIIFDFDEYSTHYEFNDAGISMVTLQLKR